VMDLIDWMDGIAELKLACLFNHFLPFSHSNTTHVAHDPISPSSFFSVSFFYFVLRIHDG
jgi:hypothetical protein